MMRDVDVSVSSHHAPNLFNRTAQLYQLCPEVIEMKSNIKGEFGNKPGSGQRSKNHCGHRRERPRDATSKILYPEILFVDLSSSIYEFR